MYPRTVKVRSKSGTVNEYVRVVEAYREGSKVKQRVVADLGRKDLLLEVLPKLRRLLTGEDRDPADPQFGEAPDWGPVLVVRALFDQLGLWGILDRYLGQAKGVPFADRAFVLVANRLIAPASEHGLAGWLETDFVCNRKGRRFIPHWHQRRRVRIHPRQLDAWYRTLDQLHAAKGQIEVALYHRLRDLFSRSRSHPESGCILNRLPRNPRYFSVNSWMIVNISYDRYLSSRTVVDFGSCKVFSMVFV